MTLDFSGREEEGIIGLIHAFRNVVDDGHDIGMSLLLCNNFPGQLPAFILNVVERRIAAFRHLPSTILFGMPFSIFKTLSAVHLWLVFKLKACCVPDFKKP